MCERKKNLKNKLIEKKKIITNNKLIQKFVEIKNY